MITGRLGAFNEPLDGGMFSGQSTGPLPVVTVDGATNSPLGIHRNSTAADGARAWGELPKPDWRAAVADVTTRLVDEQPVTDEAKRLVLELAALSKRLDKYFAARRQEQAIDLRAELASVNAKGKAAVERVRQTTEAANVARGAYNAHLEEAAKAQRELKRAKGEAPTEDDFATEDEIAAHAERLAGVQAEHDRTARESKRLHAAMKSAETAAKDAKRELAEIRFRRDELRSLLNGRRPSAIAGLGPVGLME